MNAATSAADRVDGATWRIAATVTIGAIMTSVDTTVVNVALDDLTQDFSASVAAVQLGLDRLSARAGDHDAALGLGDGPLRRQARVDGLDRAVPRRIDAGGRRVVARQPGRVPRASGARWRHDHAGRDGPDHARRGAGPRRAGDGVLGVQQLLGPVLGPVIGGVLVEHADWRWIFYVNVPVGLLAIAASARYLPDDGAQPCDRLDLRGFLMLSPGIAAVVYGLSGLSEETQGIAVSRCLLPLVLGAGLMIAFVVHARRAGNPLIDVRLFRRVPFTAGVATTFCTGIALFGALFVLPLFYQRVRGQSALDAGLLLAPQGIGAALMMPLAGRLTDRIGPGRVVLAGLVLVVVATLPFAVDGESLPDPLLALALVARGVSMGASTMPAVAGAYASLDRADLARAASVVNVVKRLGGSVGVAVVAVVLERRIPGAANAGAERAASDAVLADAFTATFWWGLAFCVLALVPAVFLPQHPVGARRQRPSSGDAVRLQRGVHGGGPADPMPVLRLE